MGQQEILDFLTKNKGKKYSSKQLAKELNVSEASIARGVRKLIKGKFIQSNTDRIHIHNVVFVWVM